MFWRSNANLRLAAASAGVAALVALTPVAGTLAQAKALNGAGATFPAPLYSKWNSVYYTASGTQVNYQSIGSGGGIKGITDGTVDFAGSDAPMSDEQLAAAKGAILHIPTVAGAVVVTYNLDGSPALKLGGDVVADIYLGKVTKWNDPRIADANPGVTLPNEEIVPVQRSDGSGTTFAFTDYLSKVSPDWAGKVGKGTSVNWPSGLGAKGNEGVAGEVKQNKNSLGYVELIYAIQNNLPTAWIKNQSGTFVEPSLDATTAAAAGALSTMPDDFRVSITDSPSPTAYPIATFTYFLVYKDQADRDKGQALVRYIWWTQNDGQRYAKDLGYAPIPEQMQPRIKTAIEAINYQGQSLFGQ